MQRSAPISMADSTRTASSAFINTSPLNAVAEESRSSPARALPSLKSRTSRLTATYGVSKNYQRATLKQNPSSWGNLQVQVLQQKKRCSWGSLDILQFLDLEQDVLEDEEKAVKKAPPPSPRVRRPRKAKKHQVHRDALLTAASKEHPLDVGVRVPDKLKSDKASLSPKGRTSLRSVLKLQRQRNLRRSCFM